MAWTHLPPNHMGLVGVLLLLISPLARRVRVFILLVCYERTLWGEEAPEGSAVNP